MKPSTLLIGCVLGVLVDVALGWLLLYHGAVVALLCGIAGIALLIRRWQWRGME